jgi:pyruvate dehydrogenase E2 component (dihydrolipoamide acetyltransferase)
MEEGTVVSTLVKPGDRIRKGDVIFEIETDKATLEMASPLDGFIRKIFVKNNDTLAVGRPMLIIGEKDEIIPQDYLDSLETEINSASPAANEESAPPAYKQAIEPALSADWLNDASTIPADARFRLGQTVPLSRLQQLTAGKMLKSKREIPCFYLTVRADVTALVELRAKLNEQTGVKITYNDLLIRAVALGLEKFPLMTGQIKGNTIQLADVIKIGLAMSAPAGLVAPLIVDANKKDVCGIAEQRINLMQKVANNKLELTDIEGGCITISNLGALGIESFIPIPIPGQCSIIGIGQITDTAIPDNNDNMVVRKIMSMTISVDHKVANGAYAAEFLDYVRKLLEDTSTFI